MRVWRSGYYHWLNKPAKLIGEQELKLYRKTKQLFAESNNSLGSRQLKKKLGKEGFQVGRWFEREML
jgi:putative transposase